MSGSYQDTDYVHSHLPMCMLLIHIFARCTALDLGRNTDLSPFLFGSSLPGMTSIFLALSLNPLFVTL